MVEGTSSTRALSGLLIVAICLLSSSSGTLAEQQQPPLMLFCNSTSHCSACTRAEVRANDHKSCRATGFNQELLCVVDVKDAQHAFQYSREIARETTTLRAGKIVTAYQPCTAKQRLSVTMFEVLTGIGLCIALPTIYWRRRALRNVGL